jgi:hypothetical protein
VYKNYFTDLHFVGIITICISKFYDRKIFRNLLYYSKHTFYTCIHALCSQLKVKKVKGHLWVLQHLCLEGVLYSYPNEFLHSSPEA